MESEGWRTARGERVGERERERERGGRERERGREGFPCTAMDIRSFFAKPKPSDPQRGGRERERERGEREERGERREREARVEREGGGKKERESEVEGGGGRDGKGPAASPSPSSLSGAREKRQRAISPADFFSLSSSGAKKKDREREREREKEGEREQERKREGEEGAGREPKREKERERASTQAAKLEPALPAGASVPGSEVKASSQKRKLPFKGEDNGKRASLGSPAQSAPPTKQEAFSPATSSMGKTSDKETPPALPPIKPAPLAAGAPPAPRKWYAGMKDDAPPNKGNKRVPVGAKDCLAGKTFVLTGTQDSLEREEMQALIVQYGGRVTGSVSRKTDFLVRGIDSETGRLIETTKTRKADELKVQMIQEDDLLDMIRVTAAQPEPEPDFEPEPEPLVTPPQPAPCANEADPSGVGATIRHSAPALWAEKYRPRDVRHLVGNADHIRRLMQWAKSWDENLHTAKAGGGAKGAGGFQKAALLSGPPGVGKTSAARIVLRQCGFDVVELNASDTRSQSALKCVPRPPILCASRLNLRSAALLRAGRLRRTC